MEEANVMILMGRNYGNETSGSSGTCGVMVLLHYAGGHIFVTNQTGTTFVMRPSSKELKIVGQNKIDERSNSTPAISDGQIFLRTFKNIYCIGK